MKIKYVKTPKRVGEKYIKKIEKYAKKPVKEPVAIASPKLYFDECYFVDKKYAARCRRLVKKYEKLNGEKEIKPGQIAFKYFLVGALVGSAITYLVNEEKNSYNIRIYLGDAREEEQSIEEVVEEDFVPTEIDTQVVEGKDKILLTETEEENELILKKKLR